MKELIMKKAGRYSASRRDICSLYTEAFPPIERIPFRTMLRYLNKPGTEMWAFYEQGRFAGFAYMLLSDRYAYLLFTATPESMRGQGVGSAIVTMLMEHYSRLSMVLDIEPVDPSSENAEQRFRRYTFYERLGFQDTHWEMVDETGHFRILATDAQGFDMEAFRTMFAILPPIFVGTEIIQIEQ